MQKGGGDSTAMASVVDRMGWDVVLVCGGDDAVGHGRPDPLVDGHVDPRVFQLLEGRHAPLVAPACDPLVHGWMARPPHGKSMGAAVTFGRWLAWSLPPERRVLLVSAGVSGSRLASGGWTAPHGPLLLRADQLCREALACAPGGPGNRLAAVLWLQGAEDVDAGVDGPSYQACLDAMVVHLRTELPGAAGRTPFLAADLMGGIGASYRTSGVRAALATLPGRARFCGFAASGSQATCRDASGYREMGYALFLCLHRLVRGDGGPAGLSSSLGPVLGLVAHHPIGAGIAASATSILLTWDPPATGEPVAYDAQVAGCSTWSGACPTDRSALLRLQGAAAASSSCTARVRPVGRLADGPWTEVEVLLPSSASAPASASAPPPPPPLPDDGGVPPSDALLRSGGSGLVVVEGRVAGSAAAGTAQVQWTQPLPQSRPLVWSSPEGHRTLRTTPTSGLHVAGAWRLAKGGGYTKSALLRVSDALDPTSNALLPPGGGGGGVGGRGVKRNVLTCCGGGPSGADAFWFDEQGALGVAHGRLAADSPSQVVAESSLAALPGRWHHLVATHRAVDLLTCVYVDGVLAGSGVVDAASCGALPSLSALADGSDSLGLDAQWLEARLWQAPLTAAEVRAETARLANVYGLPLGGGGGDDDPNKVPADAKRRVLSFSGALAGFRPGLAAHMDVEDARTGLLARTEGEWRSPAAFVHIPVIPEEAATTTTTTTTTVANGGEWLQVAFPSPVSVGALEVRCGDAWRAVPTGLVVQGSKDGGVSSPFVDLTPVVAWRSGPTTPGGLRRTTPLPRQDDLRVFRLRVGGTNGSPVAAVREVRLFAPSRAVSPSAPPVGVGAGWTVSVSSHVPPFHPGDGGSWVSLAAYDAAGMPLSGKVPSEAPFPGEWLQLQQDGTSGGQVLRSVRLWSDEPPAHLALLGSPDGGATWVEVESRTSTSSSSAGVQDRGLLLVPLSPRLYGRHRLVVRATTGGPNARVARISVEAAPWPQRTCSSRDSAPGPEFFGTAGAWRSEASAYDAVTGSYLGQERTVAVVTDEPGLVGAARRFEVRGEWTGVRFERPTSVWRVTLVTGATEAAALREAPRRFYLLARTEEQEAARDAWTLLRLSDSQRYGSWDTTAAKDLPRSTTLFLPRGGSATFRSYRLVVEAVQESPRAGPVGTLAACLGMLHLEPAAVQQDQEGRGGRVVASSSMPGRSGDVGVVEVVETTALPEPALAVVGWATPPAYDAATGRYEGPVVTGGVAGEWLQICHAAPTRVFSVRAWPPSEGRRLVLMGARDEAAPFVVLSHGEDYVGDRAQQQPVDDAPEMGVHRLVVARTGGVGSEDRRAVHLGLVRLTTVPSSVEPHHAVSSWQRGKGAGALSQGGSGWRSRDGAYSSFGGEYLGDERTTATAGTVEAPEVVSGEWAQVELGQGGDGLVPGGLVLAVASSAAWRRQEAPSAVTLLGRGAGSRDWRLLCEAGLSWAEVVDGSLVATLALTGAASALRRFSAFRLVVRRVVGGVGGEGASSGTLPVTLTSFEVTVRQVPEPLSYTASSSASQVGGLFTTGGGGGRWISARGDGERWVQVQYPAQVAATGVTVRPGALGLGHPREIRITSGDGRRLGSWTADVAPRELKDLTISFPSLSPTTGTVAVAFVSVVRLTVVSTFGPPGTQVELASVTLDGLARLPLVSDPRTGATGIPASGWASAASFGADGGVRSGGSASEIEVHVGTTVRKVCGESLDVRYPEPTAISEAAIRPNGDDASSPRSWLLLGSDGGGAWRAFAAAEGRGRRVLVHAPWPCSVYKLLVTATMGGPRARLAEVALTAAARGSEGGSRDGGTTWSSALPDLVARTSSSEDGSALDWSSYPGTYGVSGAPTRRDAVTRLEDGSDVRGEWLTLRLRDGRQHARHLLLTCPSTGVHPADCPASVVLLSRPALSASAGAWRVEGTFQAAAPDQTAYLLQANPGDGALVRLVVTAARGGGRCVLASLATVEAGDAGVDRMLRFEAADWTGLDVPCNAMDGSPSTSWTSGRRRSALQASTPWWQVTHPWSQTVALTGLDLVVPSGGSDAPWTPLGAADLLVEAWWHGGAANDAAALAAYSTGRPSVPMWTATELPRSGGAASGVRISFAGTVRLSRLKLSFPGCPVGRSMSLSEVKPSSASFPRYTDTGSPEAFGPERAFDGSWTTKWKPSAASGGARRLSVAYLTPRRVTRVLLIPAQGAPPPPGDWKLWISEADDDGDGALTSLALQKLGAAATTTSSTREAVVPFPRSALRYVLEFPTSNGALELVAAVLLTQVTMTCSSSLGGHGPEDLEGGPAVPGAREWWSVPSYAPGSLPCTTPATNAGGDSVTIYGEWVQAELPQPVFATAFRMQPSELMGGSEPRRVVLLASGTGGDDASEDDWEVLMEVVHKDLDTVSQRQVLPAAKGVAPLRYRLVVMSVFSSVPTMTALAGFRLEFT
jgi:Carbohydrate esterase, sialic acid-specific acetylesterase/Concanavalin A-like lectin/glucanases superfamily